MTITPQICMFQSKEYEKKLFQQACNEKNLNIEFFEPRLTSQTACLASGADAVVSFVNDIIDRKTMKTLHESEVKMIALRCAGYNHVDLDSAKEYQIQVVRVPEYSPFAVAEHTVCLLLALNRKIHKAFVRVHSLNFSLEGLVGFDLNGKTVGVVGTGKIGAQFCRIMNGFGCKVIAYDPAPSQQLTTFCEYKSLHDLFKESDIISLHAPLTSQTHHICNDKTLGWTKQGVILLNTSRGGLIDSKALIKYLKNGHIGAAGLDVYEGEGGVFFKDLSNNILLDDVLARLLTFPNTIITSHQAFLTQEALSNIAQITITNISNFLIDGKLTNQVV